MHLTEIVEQKYNDVILIVKLKIRRNSTFQSCSSISCAHLGLNLTKHFFEL